MTERVSIFETIQIGAEATAGTAVAALKTLQALGIQLNPSGNVNMFRPAGNKFNTVAQMGKEWTDGKASGPVAYNDLEYILASVMNKATPTASGAIRTYVHDILSTNPDTIQTYTIEQGSKLRTHRVAGGVFTGVTFDFTRDTFSVSADMIAGALVDDIAMSGNAIYALTANATPPTAGTFSLTYAAQIAAGIAWNAAPEAVQTALEALSTIGAGNIKVRLRAGMTGTLAIANNVYEIEFVGALGGGARIMTGVFTTLTASASIALSSFLVGAAITAVSPIPAVPGNLNVWVDPASASLGTTKALRVLKGQLILTGRFKPLWTVNSANSSFVALVEAEPTAKLSLTLEADAEGMAYLTDMRAGTTRFVRLKVTGDVIESATPYSFQIDVATKIGEMVKLSDQDGVYAVEVPFTMVHDATWGKAVTTTLVNTVAAL